MKNVLKSFQTIISIRPTWTWEVRKMQEQFSATPSMEIKNEKSYVILNGSEGS